ncbi:hypothetical protein ACN2C6_08000 [Caulobacter sp. ErkDOM-YI]|uniref:hypothetical protein n=1 Tax=unclassified Caulobacter TaxID=2648921 RepID=UPI003AF78C8C
MNIARFACAVLALAAATPVLAGPRLTDSQFIQASRCQALAKASSLGSSNAAAFGVLIKAQRQGRADHIIDKASEAMSTASGQARRADEAAKAGLIAERDGSCQALLAR